MTAWWNRAMMRWFLVGGGLLAGSAGLDAQQAGGRIAGQVVHGETGRPLPQAEVRVGDSPTVSLTDLQGRFRTNLLPPGTYSVTVSLIGFAPSRTDGISVTAGETKIQNFVLNTQALAVAGITVEAKRTTVTSSEAGLLSMQRAAPSVTDGISAEQIRRSPDSNAGDAILRVTGVSLVDNKFVIVRGLSERYSNTLLNGAELSSPEPQRRVVPLNVFPASLLESVLTTKAATPDKPGDFAGGSVEIRTKEFPEDRVVEFKLSGGWNSLVTFEKLSWLPRKGSDYFGFDGQGRNRGDPQATEAWAESLRSIWVPDERTVPPNFGAGLTLGDQLGSFDHAIGYVISANYGLSTDVDPDRFYQFASINAFTQEANVTSRAVNTATTTGEDWGVVANLSARLGGGNSLSLRNLVTRDAEDLVNLRQGLNFEPQAAYTGRERGYQVRYIQRVFRQHQLTGTHMLAGATIDWKATYTRSSRDEPENRSLTYKEDREGGFELAQGTHEFWVRFMDEWSGGVQMDVSVPMPFLPWGGGLFKTGGLYRTKRRDLDGYQVDFFLNGPGPWTLPPDLVFKPEIISGPNSPLLSIDAAGPGVLPYTAHDDVAAAYGMVDVPLLPGLRMVGGVRFERWGLDVTSGGLTPRRREFDPLWSANLTWKMTDKTNLRGAAYRTLSRPDPREVAVSTYVPLSGECQQSGNPDLRDAKIHNYDLRMEWYPNAGELLGATAFYKGFERPFLTFTRGGQGFGGCDDSPDNGKSSRNYGVELEVRKGLGFLSPALGGFSTSANFTLSLGEILKPPPDSVIPGQGGRFGSTDPLPLQDQSRYLFNATLGYENPDRGISVNVLGNYFSSRIKRFGPATAQVREDGVLYWIRGADYRERSRTTVDAKLSVKLGGHLSASLSGQNLTGQSYEAYVHTKDGLLPTEILPQGRSGSLSFTYRPWG